jgi:hypothetical protein
MFSGTGIAGSTDWQQEPGSDKMPYVLGLGLHRLRQSGDKPITTLESAFFILSLKATSSFEKEV